jgi:hypothetical protein
MSLTSGELKWIKRGLLISIFVYIVFYILWKLELTTEEQSSQPKTLKIMDFEIPVNGICSYGFGREGTKEWINWGGSIASSICMCLLCVFLVHYGYGSSGSAPNTTTQTVNTPF